MEASSLSAKSGDEPTVEVPEDQTDLKWFYGVVDQQKQFSDYTWDPNHPGSFKPGLTPENYSMEDVMEMWKDKPNDNVMRFTMDEVRLPTPSSTNFCHRFRGKGLCSRPGQPRAASAVHNGFPTRLCPALHSSSTFR
jgi:hypothetical protein